LLFVEEFFDIRKWIRMTEAIGVIAALLLAISQATARAPLAADRDKLVVRGLLGLSGLVVVVPKAVCWVF
jgi:hypothetical protein